MTKEELLIEAKRRYPIGTKFKTATGARVRGGEPCTVTKELYWQEKGITHSGILWVYYNGVWAEIVEPIDPMIAIQEECKRRFTIGCDFINTSGEQFILEDDHCTYKIVGSNIWASKNYGYLYRNGKYATRVTKGVEEFKKGDYIVLLKGGDDDTYSLNYCYRQDRDYRYLYTELDNKGRLNNGWALHPFNKTSENDWRYATPEEMAEYDRLRKPYDVTTLNKSIVGRYLKAVVDKPEGGEVLKGEVGKIRKANGISEAYYLTVDFPSQTGYSVDKRRYLNKNLYELMPEGFTPEESSTSDVIPEYVECIKIWNGRKKSIFGKIYKTSEKPSFSEHEFKDMHRVLFDSCFKPSTKEAYDNQDNLEFYWKEDAGVETAISVQKSAEQGWPPAGGFWFASADPPITNKASDVNYKQYPETSEECHSVNKDVIKIKEVTTVLTKSKTNLLKL